MASTTEIPLTLPALHDAYRRGSITPLDVVESLLAHWDPLDPWSATWISRHSDEALRDRARALGTDVRGPLFGALVAVKDNIDVAGLPTTAACPAFASVPQRSAAVVRRLEAAGAIVVGKTNLDQFATGLVGTRSPYGEVPNSFDPNYVSGGSSSGSAVAVARGTVHLSLGTDTAGSGRVPAAFNNIVGLKPTRGRIPTTGVVPACASLDCVSLFALTVADAWTAFCAVHGGDPDDPTSLRVWSDDVAVPAKLRVGVPRAPLLDFLGDGRAESAFRRTLGLLPGLGIEVVEVDAAMLARAAELLYGGPFVAERLVAAGALLERDPDSMDPTVRGVLQRARAFSAKDAFLAQQEVARLRVAVEALLSGVDCLLVPSVPTFPTRAAVSAAPLERNAELGRYTNAVNMLDLCALAIPGAMRDDGLPAGITLIADRGRDAFLAAVGAHMHGAFARACGLTMGATKMSMPSSDAIDPASSTGAEPRSAARASTTVGVVVVGAHLSGMPLNHQLTDIGARLRLATKTAPTYRMFAIPGTPPKPGLVRVREGGGSIEVEVWDVPIGRYGDLVASIPPPLGIGTLDLADGSKVQGFLCEGVATGGLDDITALGGWRAYVATLGTR